MVCYQGWLLWWGGAPLDNFWREEELAEICDGDRYESTGWGKKRFAWHSGPEGRCVLGLVFAGLKAGASSVAVLRRTCFAPGLRCVRRTGSGGGVDDSNSVLRGVLRGEAREEKV